MTFRGLHLLPVTMFIGTFAWAFVYVSLPFHVLAIAPVFPLVVARVAQHAGQAIGVINSARIGASFIGPVLATTVLAWTSPELLYVFLGVVGLACVPLVRVRMSRTAP